MHLLHLQQHFAEFATLEKMKSKQSDDSNAPYGKIVNGFCSYIRFIESIFFFWTRDDNFQFLNIQNDEQLDEREKNGIFFPTQQSIYGGGNAVFGYSQY